MTRHMETMTQRQGLLTPIQIAGGVTAKRVTTADMSTLSAPSAGVSYKGMVDMSSYHSVGVSPYSRIKRGTWATMVRLTIMHYARICCSMC